jgi:hypothetical protein
MAGAEFITVRKPFSETVREVKELEQQKIELVPKELELEWEKTEIKRLSFQEALSELRRLSLIKRLKRM